MMKSRIEEWGKNGLSVSTNFRENMNFLIIPNPH